MRTCLISIILFCISFATLKADNTKLIVSFKDGNKIAYILDKKPKLTFSNSNLVVAIDDINVDYPLEGILQWSYEDNDITAIANRYKSDDISLCYSKDRIVIMPHKKDCTFLLSSTNGVLVFQTKVKAEEQFVFPLSNLNSGVYIVTVNGISNKITKQ